MIFFAVHGGKLDIFERLLDIGTSPDVVCPGGLPLLAFVILHDKKQHQHQMARLLLIRGANPLVIPVLAYDDPNGPKWNLLQVQAREEPLELPEWCMAAPEWWLEKLEGSLDIELR